MNGIFLNTKKIDSLKLTRLDLGQMIGIGAMSATNQDYFVFDLLKTVVKEEKVGLNLSFLYNIHELNYYLTTAGYQ